MALTNQEKVLVVSNHPSVQSLNFRELMKQGIIAHARTILYNENSETYASITNVGRKALVDRARLVIDNPESHVSQFIDMYVSDSNVTFETLISKIADVVPSIYPEVAGLIRFDRP